MKDIHSVFCQFASVAVLSAAFGSGFAQAASVDLWQARNGAMSTPTSPVEWVKGNAGPANSHYNEGHSIPYRLVISDLTAGPHRVVIEWDTRQKSKHAIDFLTHYNRLLPHDQFSGHSDPESINPLDGLAGSFAAPSMFPIPTPSTTGSPVAGQPATSFHTLAEDFRSLTIWNGTVTQAVYVSEGSLTNESAATRLAIDFVANNPTVVLSFGGHIASKLDWGAGNSAISIGGSPYHMRMISLDGTGGNQDRSVQATAVLSPPTAAVSGPDVVCENSTNTYVAITDATNGATFRWKLPGNASGAFIVGTSDASTVQVAAGEAGTSYSVELVVTANGLTDTASQSTAVMATTTATALTSQTRCPGEGVTFETTPGGTGPLTFVWRKDGQIIGNATNHTLRLSNLLPSDSGAYCVEVGGTCGTVTRCANLTVITLPTLTCPPDLDVQCFAEVPPPAAETVAAVAGSEPFAVIHAGDVLQTNGPVITITRTYTTTGQCPVSCQQIVTVRDTVAPAVACPSNLFRLEDAPDSGAAPVEFLVPVGNDRCDPAPTVVCTPPPGTRFAVGDTVVDCVATDVSGNSSACAFTIRVVPQTIVAFSTADSGPGTLRQALLDANAAEGANVIEFAFPGTPPYVIHLLSPLPDLSDPVIIDGWSHLQFQGEPIIELDGTNAVPGPVIGRAGLSLAAGGATVRGLVLNGFTTGIRVGGSGGHVIQGNFIGIDPASPAAGGNTGDGLVVVSPNNLIGGPTSESRNVISRNGGHGLVLESPLATGNLVVSNLIGTAIDGVTPAGNGLAGVAIRDGAAGNRIGSGNIIAYNGGNGVLVESTAGAGNSILGNIITGNGAIGIDLGGDGISDNDDGDADTGGNETQNFPVLLSARTDGATTVIRGTLESAPNRSYFIEIFARVKAFAGALATPALVATVSVTTDAAGLGSFEVTVAAFLPAGSEIFATATDPANSTSEFSLGILVASPPIILSQPMGTTAAPGGPAGFCVTASGTEPLAYQWRRNGANITDATNECFVISAVELADGGTYTVVIRNELGAVTSDPALLVLDLPRIAAGDNFVDRTPLIGLVGIASGTNLFATREPGEPFHAGKPGGSSVWYTWTAPDTGIATFRTTGSTFDTLLGVYTGLTVDALTTAASDEDQGGFYTSGVRFNTSAGSTYHIAIDGFGGASGVFVFEWSLEATGDFLPIITSQPISQTVAPGSAATFVVVAIGNCRYIDHDCRTVNTNGRPDHPDPRFRLSYQWYFNGVPIPGATAATLSLSSVQDSAVGTYSALVNNGSRALFSQPAILQINLTEAAVQNVRTADKFMDAVGAPPLQLGAVISGAPSGIQPASVVRGYTGTQVFNTSGSATETGEGPICGPVVGGASQWISFIAEDTGTVFLNTDGSSYDTVIAVYARSTNGTIQQLACDNNGGLDGRDSALTVPVTVGRTNFILLDGVNGATGTLRLNYSLVTPSFLTPLGQTAQGANRVRVTGRPGVKFTLQASANISSWSSLITTNAPTGTFDFIDTRSTNSNPRYYRALLLP